MQGAHCNKDVTNFKINCSAGNVGCPLIIQGHNGDAFVNCRSVCIIVFFSGGKKSCWKNTQWLFLKVSFLTLVGYFFVLFFFYGYKNSSSLFFKYQVTFQFCFLLKDFRNKITTFISTITSWFTLAYPSLPRETWMTHLTVEWGIQRLEENGFSSSFKVNLVPNFCRGCGGDYFILHKCHFLHVDILKGHSLVITSLPF